MEKRPNIVQVPIDYDLDVTTVQRTRKLLDGLIDGDCCRVILNMAGSTYLDSAGMALLFREVRRMRAVGGLLSLVNVSDRVLRSLAISRLVDFAPVTGVGAHREIPELDPTVIPNWRRVLSIDPACLSDTRTRFEQLVSRMPFSADEVFDLTLAVGEAMGNAVDHTDGRDALVSVASYPDRVVVDVTDCGDGFEVEALEDVPVAGEADERGRGIRLMHLLVDSVSIERRAHGKGIRVHIVKLVRAGA